MTRPFRPIERTSIAERVRHDLLDRVRSGELQPAAQLPAERTLAAQFGVARTSVREAIEGLVALDVLERRGNGLFVVERLPGVELSAPDGGEKSLHELLEARRVMERSLFRLAAERASPDERREILDLARISKALTIKEFALADRRFHAKIAGACGNPILIEVYVRILDALLKQDMPTESILGLTVGADPSQAIVTAENEHIALAHAYVKGDVDGVVAVIDGHLSSSR